MKKWTPDQQIKFMLFVSPVYWTLVVIFIAVVIWRTSVSHPDVVTVTLISAAIIITAVFLVKGYAWISLPMMILGIYIAQLGDQFAGHIQLLYGVYLVVHYLVCGVYVFRKKRTP